jgi:hypothetical protein
MSVVVGKPYRFRFTDADIVSGVVEASKFSLIDGIYLVKGITDYSGVLRDNVKLTDGLYRYVSEPSQVNADFQADLTKLKTANFYKLQAVEDIFTTKTVVINSTNVSADVKVVPKDAILYVPTYLVAGLPDPDVQEYAKLMMTIDLGPFADPELLATLKDTVGQILEAYHGIDRDGYSDPSRSASGRYGGISAMIYSSAWLTQDDYKAIEASREVTATDANASSARFKRVNYYLLAKQRQETIARLNAKIAAYEEIINTNLP